MSGRVSLQRKLWIWTTSLVFCLGICLYFFVHHVIEKDIIDNIDRKLNTIHEELQKAYTSGFQYAFNTFSTDFSQVPPEIISKVHSAFPRLSISLWKKMIKDDIAIYEIRGQMDELLYEIEVDYSGKIIEIETEDREGLPSLVVKEFNVRFGDLKQYWLIAESISDNQILSHTFQDMDCPVIRSDHSGPYTESLNKVELRIMNKMLNPELMLRVGCNLTREEDFMQSYRNAFWIAMGPSFLLSFLLVAFFSRSMITDLNKIEQGLQRFGQGIFDTRIKHEFSIQEFYQLAIQFNDMALQIENLISEMKHITDQVAHDIRTPLTRMKIEIEVSQENNPHLPSKLIDNLLENITELDDLISTLLEISQMDSHLLELDLQPCNLNQLTADAVDLFAIIAEKKSLELKFIQPEALIEIHADIRRLQRVISNLIDNALKFTNQGYVHISIETDPQQVIWKIQDSGIGIGEQDKEHVLNRFYRSHNSMGIVGHGLGLSYVDSVIRAMGGEVSIDSQLDKGTCVRFSCPLRSSLKS